MTDIKKAIQFCQKNKIRINSNVFYYLILLTIAIITIYPLFGTGIASADDMGNYINTRFGKEFYITKYLAEMSGRFYFTIFGLVHNLPYEIDDMFITKLFQVVPILLCLFLFYKIVLSLTKSKEVSSLFVLLFFVIAQFSHHTSLFLTYPFYFTFSFSIILLAYLLLHRFQVTKKKRYLLYSSLLFGFGLMFYEVYILFFGFAALSVLYVNFQEGKKGVLFIKNIVLQILPFAVVVLCYGMAYILYSHYHPSAYAGTSMTGNNITFGTFFMVLWKLSFSAFPLTEYDSDLMQDFFRAKSEMLEGYRNIVPYLFYHAHIEWIVKSILVFFMGYFMMIRIPRISYKILVTGLLLSVLLTFIPHIPLALTPKYTFYVMTQEMHGYVTAFFSLFGVILFISILSTFLLNFTSTHTPLRHGMALFISLLFVLCSFLTDFSNYYVTRDVHQANIRMRAVDEMIQSDAFKNIPPKSNIYSAQLWNNYNYMAGGITEQGFQWMYYILCKSGINQSMIRDDKAFLKSIKASAEPGYRVIYRQAVKSDNALLVLAQLENPGTNDSLISNISNKMIVVYYSTCKYFSVSFKRVNASATEKEKIKINHINDVINPGNYVEFSIYNTQPFKAATIFTMELPSVDIRTIRISDLVNSESQIFYL